MSQSRNIEHSNASENDLFIIRPTPRTPTSTSDYITLNTNNDSSNPGVRISTASPITMSDISE